jgi:hypothetical protein
MPAWRGGSSSRRRGDLDAKNGGAAAKLTSPDGAADPPAEESADPSPPAFLIHLLGFLVSRLICPKKENAGYRFYNRIRHFVDVQQRLNCALSVVSSSLDFFRYRGLNGMS